MTTLILGASGATGQLLARQLLQRGQDLKIVVRSLDGLPEDIRNHQKVSAIQASVLDLSDAEMIGLVRGCHAVASCLGHNLTFKGMFGKPRRLVTDATRRICDAIRSTEPDTPVKFVLMNTTGNSNRDLNEPVSMAQKCVIGLLRLLLPPHVDNEKAADYLRCEIGQGHPLIEWAAVRPDNLSDENKVSTYEIHASPQRSAIFDAGTTSRINVADFMARLVSDDELWKNWNGQMPVIYNAAQPD